MSQRKNPKKNLEKQVDKYLENVNKQLKESIGFQYDKNDRNLLKQLVFQMDHSGTEHSDTLIALLEQVGYTNGQISAVLEELNAVASLRLLLKLYQSIPEKQRDSIVEISERLTPTQTIAMVETVYKNNTKEELETVATGLQNDTINAFYKDINHVWEEIKAIMRED